MSDQVDISQALEEVASAFSGKIGLAATNLDTNQEVKWNADVTLPIASVLKVPVLFEVLQQADDGILSLNQVLEPVATHRTYGSGVLKELSDSVRMTVHDLGILMIVLSDNTSTNALIDLVGGIDVVNSRMQRLGFSNITLYSNIPLPQPIEPGQPMPNVRTVAEAKPTDLANLFAGIARHTIASERVCEGMLAIMKRQHYVDQVPRYFDYDSMGRELGIVQRVGVACKTGGHPYPATRCDAGVITMGSEDGPGPRFSYAVLNTDGDDASMSFEAEGAIVNATIGRLLLEHWWPPEFGPVPVRDLPSWRLRSPVRVTSGQ
jgi:beta-lactamase class A